MASSSSCCYYSSSAAAAAAAAEVVFGKAWEVDFPCLSLRRLGRLRKVCGWVEVGGSGVGAADE